MPEFLSRSFGLYSHTAGALDKKYGDRKGQGSISQGPWPCSNDELKTCLPLEPGFRPLDPICSGDQCQHTEAHLSASDSKTL